MRIIGGSLKRRKLFFPATHCTRPVTDRSKETIFNVLGELTENAHVLDLFAGSGSLGLEALSRDASEAVFVDSASIAIECIRKNLDTLQLRGSAQTLQMTSEQALEQLKSEGKKFDLIFTDPPHNKGLTKNTLHQIERCGTLTPRGLIIVGHSNREGLPEDLKTLRFQRSIKIGQAFVSLISMNAGDA